MRAARKATNYHSWIGQRMEDALQMVHSLRPDIQCSSSSRRTSPRSSQPCTHIVPVSSKPYTRDRSRGCKTGTEEPERNRNGTGTEPRSGTRSADSAGSGRPEPLI